MSDSEPETMTMVQVPVVPAIKEKKKRVLSEKHKTALINNIAKARAVRSAKKIAREKGEDEDKTILKELLAKEKAAKAKSKGKAPKPESEDESDADADEVDGEEDEKDEDESDSESDSANSASSDSEAEFVLKKRKPAAKKAAAPKGKGKEKKEAMPKRSTMLEQMEIMAAELKALKKEKRSSKAPVNVNISYPEQKSLSQAAKSAIISL